MLTRGAVSLARWRRHAAGSVYAAEDFTYGENMSRKYRMSEADRESFKRQLSSPYMDARDRWLEEEVRRLFYIENIKELQNECKKLSDKLKPDER
jgi:hypothetical protein